MKTILVTGVGAIIGYGILRSLRSTMPELRLIGTDIYPDAVGRAWCDEFVPAPPTSDAGYQVWLESCIHKKNIDLVIPGIEQDVHKHSDLYSHHNLRNCTFALNTRRLIEYSKDKWLMDQELVRINEPTRIRSLNRGDFNSLASELGLPFLLKPRQSYASKGIVNVNKLSDFQGHEASIGHTLIAQPIIGTEDEEYTVSVFGDGQGKYSASIFLKRILAQDGSTAKASVCNRPSLEEHINRLCAHFRPTGPTNLQFRYDGNHWKLLEINPRISSATSIRNAFGYHEAEMTVRFYLDGTLPTQPSIRDGTAVRYIEDYVTYDRNHL